MILIEVEEYCNNCLDFTPDVTKPQKLYSVNKEEMYLSNTIVRCEYRKRCAGIKRYVESQLKNETGAVG